MSVFCVDLMGLCWINKATGIRVPFAHLADLSALLYLLWTFTLKRRGSYKASKERNSVAFVHVYQQKPIDFFVSGYLVD